jgi:hypothetical protein
MRRLRRLRTVKMDISEGFYRELVEGKREVERKMGLSHVTIPQFSEMIFRSGLKLRVKKWKKRAK